VGGAALAKRILDLRSGKPCDYRKLVHEVQRRMRRDRQRWRPAADTLAAEVNEDHEEAIVRGLNRNRGTEGIPKRPTPSAGSPPPLLGAGLLYEHMKEVLVRIRREAMGSPKPDAFFEVRAKTADLIRSWLERRHRDLAEAGKDAAVDLFGALAGELGAVEQVFDPGFLYDAEMIRLQDLISLSRALQVQIDASRPSPTLRDF
jgi:hypothetical protein